MLLQKKYYYKNKDIENSDFYAMAAKNKKKSAT